MRKDILAFVLLSLSSSIGCADRVRLVNSDGASLSYDCSDIRPHATRSAELSLVRAYAQDIVRDPGIAPGTVSALIDAYSREDVGALERMVARQVCAQGGRALPATVSAKPPRFPDAGTPAADFAFVTVGTEPDSVRLASLRGRIVLLDFWSTWCGPCRDRHADMVDLSEEFRQTNLSILLVVHEDTRSNIRRWTREHGMGAMKFVSDDGEAARRYGISGIPHMFLIDENGRMVDHCTGCQWGRMGPAELRTRLKQLVKGATSAAR